MGRPRRAEAAWLQALEPGALRLSAARPVQAPTSGVEPGPTTRLYGSLDVRVDPPDWSAHPLTGWQAPLDHWSTITEGDPTQGDIKDLWELGRLAWLTPMLGSTDGPEACWRHIESFVAANPPFRGPQWMCGQESSLRGIVVAVVASALRDHPSSTPDRFATAARLLAQTVGRVRPSLGYALSQRNNHGVSEAAFLWTATYLVDGLPEAPAIRVEAARALAELTDDLWYPDGSFAQHSPTYLRLALHGMQFVLAVARSAGVSPPPGVADVVGRSAPFLTRLAEPTSGATPNLGGNDGALLFDLSARPIGDLRPVIVHAAAATGRPSSFPPGPWDAEAVCFGWAVTHDPTPIGSDPDGVAIHVHRGARTHAVLRGGPLRHRPAHADQLHVDVWIGTTNVTADPGSYRYTAPPPWGNAFASEDVHCLPRVPGRPQAERRGRFFWVDWAEAAVVARRRSPHVDVTVLELPLGDATLRRAVARIGDLHAIADLLPPGAIVRWNLPADAEVDGAGARGDGWHARFTPDAPTVRERTVDDPTSGWSAPDYARLTEVLALEHAVGGLATACFAPLDVELDLPAWLGDVARTGRLPLA